MLRRPYAILMSVFAIGVSPPATAAGLEILKGQFTFDWHSEPGKQTCQAIDDKLFVLLASDKFTCNLEVVTNTASDAPARICTEKGEGREYMIFASKEACELERKTQADNGE